MNTKHSKTSDINLLSHFLAHPQISDLSTHPPVECITLCVSSVLHQATLLFRTLEAHPTLTKTLILCGGIGHSTPLIYKSISQHPIYHTLTPSIQGLPEARVLEKILETFFDGKKITSQGCRVLVEDQSTNCGANAVRTRELLGKNGVETPRSMIVVQDTTMALRTVASFQKVYEGVEIEIKSAPMFTPLMKSEGNDGELRWDLEKMGKLGMKDEYLWEKQRYYDLIIGEIPRLRDDVEGYGPKGKGFIAHVDIPDEAEEAWNRLSRSLGGSR